MVGLPTDLLGLAPATVPMDLEVLTVPPALKDLSVLHLTIVSPVQQDILELTAQTGTSTHTKSYLMQ